MNRPLAIAVLLVAAAGVPGLFGEGVDIPDDALYYSIPAWEWLAHALGSGDSPWYVPGKLGGISLFADVVPFGPFYPAIVLVLLPPVLGLGIAALLHALGTFFAVRWLARLRGATEPSSILAGAAVVLGPLGAAAFIDYQVDTWATFLWFPVVLGCLEKASGASRRRWIAAGGAALALLILGSHLRLSAASCAALGLWGVVRGRDLRGFVAVFVLGVIGGAPGFVPMLLESRIDAAGSLLAALTSPPGQALGLASIPGWLVPNAFVVDRDIGVGVALGVGLLALRPKGADRRLAVWVALLVLAGTRIPLVQLLFAPLTLLSHPVNLVYPGLASIPLAVLAARGFDRLLAGRPATRTRALQLGAALLALAALRVALDLGFHSAHARAIGALGVLQAAVALGLVARLLMRPGRSRTRAARLVFFVALADLAGFTLRAQLAVPSEPLQDLGRGLPALSQPHLDLQELSSAWDSRFAAAQAEAADPLLAAERAHAPAAERDEVENNTSAIEIDGPAMQAELLHRARPAHQALATGHFELAGRSKIPPRRQLDALAPLSEAIHDVRAVEYVLQSVFATPGAVGTRTAALHGVERASWGDVVAFELPPPPPACYAADAAEVVDEPAERMRRLLDRPAGAGPALVEEPIGPLGPAEVSCDAGGLSATSDGPALAVRRLRWHPGWTVRDAEGRRYDTVPVNQVHTGVLLPGGSHRLEFRFQPPGLRASLAAGALAWLTLALLAFGPPRRAGALLLGAGLLVPALLAPAAAQATAISGRVAGWSPHASYRVTLVDDLDLTADRPPIASAAVADGGAFDLTYPERSGDAWLLLHEEVPVDGGPDLLFVRPLDLLPFDAAAPPDGPVLRGVPPGMAKLRASGTPVPAFWLVPSVSAVLLFGFGLLVLWAVRWRLDAASGARQLVAVLRKEPAPPPLPPRILDHRAAPLAKAPRPAPPGRREQLALGAVLAVGAGLRLPGLWGSFELLEHTYGPGTARIAAESPALLDALVQGLTRPGSVEVTHPPLYHWLLALLGTLSQHEALLRLPAFAFSLGTLVLVWRLGRRISVPAALAGAAAFAFAGPAVHFGRDATPYALVGFVCLAAVHRFLRALASGRRLHWAQGWGLLAVGFLCHYTVAFFGAAIVLALGVLALARLRSEAWLGAIHRGTQTLMWAAPLPLLWLLVHFAWFTPVALDTQLFADTYPHDPGLAVFLSRFVAVGCGVAPSTPWGALALLLLAGRGLLVCLREDRPLGLLLLSMVGAFLGGAVFLHGNLVTLLGGRIFWGFRWVSWFLPVMALLGGVGLLAGGGSRRARGVRAGLALTWVVAAALLTLRLPEATNRPDYRAAARFLESEFEHRDAVATLPLWGQQGPLTWYLTRDGEASYGEIDGVEAWRFGDKAVFLEALDEELPAQSSLLNAHVERWWLAVVDEQVFDHPKFSPEVAAALIADAGGVLVSDGRWRFAGIELHRFRRPALEPPRSVTADRRTLASRRWLEPNTGTCVAEEEGEEGRWLARVRVPRGSDPRVRNGELGTAAARAGASLTTLELLGGPCGAAAPVLGISGE